MRYILSSLLMIAGLLVFAQQTTDVVYLKNGSIIKGKIIEQSENNLKIETCCGSIFAFPTNDIDKLESLNIPLPGYLKAKGYYNYTSMGILIGSNTDDNRSIFSVLMEHNYQFNPYFSIGALIGIEFFNESVAPIGINVKGMIPMKGRSTFYIGCTGGYSIPLEEVNSDNYYDYTDTKGGVLFNSEAGIIIPSNNNINIFLALGYRYNELNYTRNDWYYDDVDRKVTYNRFSLKLGIVLH